MKNATIALIFMAVAAPAYAQQYPSGGGGGGRGGHHHVDPEGNPDGMSSHREPKPMKPISRADFETKVREQFAAADLDHNGYVTLDEVRAAREAKRDARINAQFAEIDTNHDGTISHDEFLAWQRHMGDPEMNEHREPLKDHPIARNDDMEGGDGERGDHRGYRERSGAGIANFLIAPVNANMIIEADTNHDGNLSLAEDLTYQDARFAAADTDHDGALDEDEIRAAREKIRKAQQ